MKKVGISVILLVCLFFLSGCGCERESIKNYTVTFNTNGGSNVSSMTVEENGTVNSPTNPTKEGYTFDGWYLNDNKYDFNTKITNDITLQAKWIKGDVDVKESYTITFNTDGGSSVKSIKVTKGEQIGSLVTPTKEGYTFDGWYNGSKKVSEDTKVTANMTLTAKWSKKSTNDNGTKYTVKFNSNGGSNVAKQTVLSGKTAKTPKAPTRSGYTFAGWTLNGKSYNFNSKVTANITLVANWTKNATNTEKPVVKPDEPIVEAKKYTVSFEGTNTKLTIEEGQKISSSSIPKTATKSGYKFLSWDYDFNKAVTGNITIKAKWEKVDSYTYKTEALDMAGISYKVYIYKNGTNFTSQASAVYTTSGSYLGRYDNAEKAIIVDKSKVSSIGAIKVDGKLINLSK